MDLQNIVGHERIGFLGSSDSAQRTSGELPDSVSGFMERPPLVLPHLQRSSVGLSSGGFYHL
jgi:hypothetical protein